MISYYDLVELLHSYSKEPINETMISNLNNLEVDLKGDRYFRFIDHLTILITERLENALINFENKMMNTVLNKNNFIIEFREILQEITFVKELASIKLVLDENKEEFERTIKKSINNMLDRITDIYLSNTDDKFVLEEIKNAYEVI